MICIGQISRSTYQVVEVMLPRHHTATKAYLYQVRQRQKESQDADHEQQAQDEA